MSRRVKDLTNYELQVAAAWFALKSSFRDTASELAIWYQNEKFDAVRVHHLVRLAEQNGFIEKPKEKWTFIQKAFSATGRAPGMLDKVEQMSIGVSFDADISARLQAQMPDPGNQPLSVHVVRDTARSLGARNTTSSFAHAAASIVTNDLASRKRGIVSVGVTWGATLQDFAMAVTQATTKQEFLPVRVLPVVGTPLGLPRDADRSSSRIAETLSHRWGGTIAQFRCEDLSLIPAYIPQSIQDKDLPAIYRMFLLVRGFTEVFGRRDPWGQDENRVAPIAALDVLITSISDLGKPYGFSGDVAPGFIPFTQSTKKRGFIRPVADIGGVPLWEDPRHENGPDETEFLRRWNGIRRDDMRNCAHRCHLAANFKKTSGGVVLLTPTREKAIPTLLCVRAGLVNTVILGEECAKAIEAYLSDEAGTRMKSERRRATRT